MAILRSNGVLIVDSIPTHIPTGDEAILAWDNLLDRFYKYDGVSWSVYTATVGVEQGLSIDTNIKLGDDAVGIGEPGVLLSTRYINQDGNPVIFVGEDIVGVTNVEISDDGKVILRSTDTGTAESAYLELNARHNNVGGWNSFITRFPGNTSIPANNTVIPFVEHALVGDDGTGFNEAPQADYVYVFGINVADSPNFDNRIGGVAISMESYYDAMDDTTGRQELHFVRYDKTTGTGNRLFTYQGFEDTALGSSGAFQLGLDSAPGAAFSLRTIGGDERVSFDWGNQQIRVYNDISLNFQENNYAAILQSNAAGNSSIEIARVNVDDNVAVAGNYVFKTGSSVLYSVTGGLSLGDDTNPISQGVLVTSSNGDLLKLKEDAGSEYLMVTRATPFFQIGFQPTGVLTGIQFHEDTPHQTFGTWDTGGVTVGGAGTGGNAKLCITGQIGDKSISAQSANANNGIIYYGGGTAANIFLFNSDLNATGKAIGQIQNYQGDVQLVLYPNTGAATKTASILYAGQVTSYHTGLNRVNDSFHIYLGGDVLAGGTSVMEFTSVGRIIPNIPVYADDAAAGVGGLTAGMLYKTATGEVRIKT